MARWRSLFIFAVWLICAVLAGCNRQPNSSHIQERTSEAASSTAAVSAQPATSDHRPLIVAFGDSLTAGVASPSYPDVLQDILDRQGYAYRVENQGVSGDTTTDGLARIDNVIVAHPALVLLEFGGNDGLRGTPVDATRKNLEQMIERLREAKIPIVLLGITLPPNYGAEYVKPFTAMYPEMAHKYHLRFAPFLLLHVYNVPGMMQPDGIHPSGEGNRIVAEDVFELIQPLLTARK